MASPVGPASSGVVLPRSRAREAHPLPAAQPAAPRGEVIGPEVGARSARLPPAQKLSVQELFAGLDTPAVGSPEETPHHLRA